MMDMAARALLLLLLSSTVHAAVEGEGLTKSLGAVRTTTPPQIDGDLDDEVWKVVPADDHFTQLFPKENSPPTEKTDVRVLYDDHYLYIAVRNYDTKPDQLTSRLTRRDRDVEADWLAIYIDSRHDHASGFCFQLSAAGVMVDGVFFNDNQFDIDWDAVWAGKVRHTPHGWDAEFAIPLTVLRFSAKDEQEWGFQVHRNVSRKREQSVWTYSPSHVQGQASRWGHLTGLKGLQPRRTFELRPYGVARVRANSLEGGPFLGLGPGSEVDPSYDIGVDLKLGLTSRLTLDATVNPDFGQVEADQVVLNLSRFETFFPEKRPFFLEGRELFDSPLNLFYPRRIGRPPVGFGIGRSLVGPMGESLSVTDNEGSLRIWTATKVTGGLNDKLSIGVLGAVTAAENVTAVDSEGMARTVTLAPERSYTTMRLKYALGKSANVGVLATAVNRLSGDIYRADLNHDDYAQGVDGWWRSSDGLLRVDGQAVISERIGGSTHRTSDGRACEDPAGDPTCLPIARADGTRMGPGALGFGGFLKAEKRTQDTMIRGVYTTLSPKLDVNAMGFQPNFNSHKLEVVGVFGKRRPSGPFNNWAIIPVAVAEMAYDGFARFATVGVDTEFLTKNFIFTSAQIFFNLPGTYDPFETLDGGRFESAGAAEFNWVVNTNPAKRFWGQARIILNKTLADDGSYLGLQTSFRVQPLDNFELSLDPEIGIERARRFYDCSPTTGAACLVEMDTRNYLFAQLVSKFASFTLRGTYTVATNLSLQAYAQLFLAAGDFSDYRETATMGDKPFIDRDALTPSTFDGDFDGDGTKDDGFEAAALNMNVVVRWEPEPGSTLFAVYTRNQEAPYTRLNRLDRGPTEDVFLLKFVYYVE
jgi:hypothetical protein